MVKVNDILEYQTRSGQDIKFRYELDIESDRTINRQWIVHQVVAVVDGQDVGYLKISYVPQERMERLIPGLLAFMDSQGKSLFPSETKQPERIWQHLDVEEKRTMILHLLLYNAGPRTELWRSITQSNLRELDENQINALLIQADDPKTNPNAAAKYEKFKKFHVDRPMVDFIRVDDKFRRQRIGIALYHAASQWLDQKFGLLLHASGLQQPEAEAAWTKMEQWGWVRPAPGDSSRRIIHPRKIPYKLKFKG